MPGMILGLHIHDNHDSQDEHLLPGLGALRWDEILQALADVDHNGTFTLETCFFDQRFDSEALPELLALESAVSRRLIQKLKTFTHRHRGWAIPASNKRSSRGLRSMYTPLFPATEKGVCRTQVRQTPFNIMPNHFLSGSAANTSVNCSQVISLMPSISVMPISLARARRTSPFFTVDATTGTAYLPPKCRVMVIIS